MEGGEGWMDGQKYTCVFDSTKECSVKTEYKLKPESLVEFCKICNKETKGMNINAALESATVILKSFIDAVNKREDAISNREETLLQLIENLVTKITK